MESTKDNYRYGIRSTLPQLLAISGLCTLQIGLGAKEMFCFVIVKSSNENQTWLETLFCACTLLGCLQSTLLLGPLGHRKCVALACAEYLAAELALAGAGRPDACVGLMALSAGASVGPCVAYVGEVCDPRIRGAACAAVHALHYASFAAFTTVYGAELHERGGSAAGPMAVAAAFPVATVAIMAFAAPDSPMWLLAKGEHEKARKTFDGLRGNVVDSVCAREFQEMVNYTSTATSRDVPSALCVIGENNDDGSSAWKQLLRPEVLRPVRRVVTHCVSMNFLFKIHLLIFMEELFNNIFINGQTNNKESEIVEVAKWVYLPLFGNVVTVLLINKLGKRFIELFSLSTSSVCCIVFTLLTMYCDPEIVKNTVNVFQSLLILIPSIGIEPIGYILITEIFPAKSRYITCNICPALIFIITFMMQVYYKEIIHANIFYGYSTLVYGIIGLIDCLFMYYNLKETENKSLWEISKLFK